MCKTILAAVLIIGCIALSEFLMDDSGSLDESGYSAPALVGGDRPYSAVAIPRKSTRLHVSKFHFAFALRVPGLNLPQTVSAPLAKSCVSDLADAFFASFSFGRRYAAQVLFFSNSKS